MKILQFLDDSSPGQPIERALMEHDLDQQRLSLLHAGEVVRGDSGILYRREYLPAEATRNI